MLSAEPSTLGISSCSTWCWATVPIFFFLLDTFKISLSPSLKLSTFISAFWKYSNDFCWLFFFLLMWNNLILELSFNYIYISEWFLLLLVFFFWIKNLFHFHFTVHHLRNSGKKRNLEEESNVWDFSHISINFCKYKNCKTEFWQIFTLTIIMLETDKILTKIAKNVL